MRLEVLLGPVLDVGVTPQGHRRVVPIRGGRFSGPRLSGVVLDGGADRQIVHPGGWVRVEAHYTLQATTGELISIVSRGVRHGPPEVMADLAAGGSPDPDSYRFRTAISFEAASSGHDWVNHLVAVGSATRTPSAVHLDVYEVR